MNDIKSDILVIDTGADQSIICGESWTVTHQTGRSVLISAYLQDQPPQEYPIVSACTMVLGRNTQKWLIRINEAIYVEGKGHRESLLHPFQAMRHGVRFDMTPHGYKKADGEIGQQLLIVSDTKIPLEYDTKKLYIHLRKPSVDEMSNAEIIELTSSQPFSLEEDVEDIEPARVNLEKVFSRVSLKDWRKRLGFAPDEIIKKTLEATTQYCLVPEEENREMPRRHYKSRFPFLREKRLNDEVHSDTFFQTLLRHNDTHAHRYFTGKIQGLGG